jgi:hypothetical protein
MVYPVGLAEVMPCIDSRAECGHCGGTIIWDELHGWLHTSGWYACHNPASGQPREVMAEPTRERP